MLWRDRAIVLSARRFGENALLLDALTLAHGRHGGLVRGGSSKRAQPFYQPGNRLELTWRARLDDQLGQYTAEPEALIAGRLLDDPPRLLCLSAAAALSGAALPERDPHPNLFHELVGLGERLLDDPAWPAAYVRFELALLTELGFGLDLRCCAVTGAQEDLVYVSPTSGRAVSRAGAGAYAPRLLPLPAFLRDPQATGDGAAVLDGLRLTGAFLQRHLFDATDRAAPPARERLLVHLTRRLQTSAS